MESAPAGIRRRAAVSGEALWASAPIVAVLALMLWRRWSSAQAGAAGLAVSVVAGWLHFGLTWQVFWVSQARGVALSLYILYIIWAALLLYRVVQAAGGIEGLERWLLGLMDDRPAAALLFAWCLSGVLEGIAGFGVPLAVIAPMLVALGLSPVTAVAATAVGHAWSVTFGDMGVVFEALVSVVSASARDLVLSAALLLGLSCVVSGWAVARLVGLQGRMARVTGVGLAMAGVQGLLVLSGLRPLAALGGGAAGLAAGVLLLGRKGAPHLQEGSRNPAAPAGFAVLLGLGPYLLAAGILALPAFVPSVAEALQRPSFAVALPEVSTRRGWITPAGETKSMNWLSHPGTAMVVALALAVPVFRGVGRLARGDLERAARRTLTAAAPASAGILSMIGVAMVMDHTGMVQELARAASALLGRAFPAVSPMVGMLGAFTTGSNTSSNVLFGPLQESMATLLGLGASWLLAAQTTGGALGSMVAPAKLVVGCASVGAAGCEGEVLRRTAPLALVIAALVGAATLALA